MLSADPFTNYLYIYRAYLLQLASLLMSKAREEESSKKDNEDEEGAGGGGKANKEKVALYNKALFAVSKVCKATFQKQENT